MPQKRTAIETIVAATRKKKKKEEETVVTPSPVTPPQITPPPVIPPTGGTYTDPRTGRVSGIELPDGRTFLGLSPKEVASIQQKEKITDMPTIQEAAQLERTKELAGQVGQVPPPGAPIADILDYEQAAKSALGLTAAGIAGGAATGAAAGLIGGPAAPITVPAAAAIGGVVGGVSTFVAGFRSNLKTQRKDMLTGEAANIRKIESNMLKHIMNVDKGGDPYEWLDMFNEQMSIANENYERLNLETTDDLSLWLGEDGKTQMEKYEIFYSPGGGRDLLNLQMQEAIRSPNPNRVYPQELDSSVPEE